MHEAKTLFKEKKELNDIIMQYRVGTQKLIIGIQNIQNNICGIFFFFLGNHIFGSKKVLFEEAPEKCFLLKHFFTNNNNNNNKKASLLKSLFYRSIAARDL